MLLLCKYFQRMETSSRCWWTEQQRFGVTYHSIRQPIRFYLLFGTRIIFQSTGECALLFTRRRKTFSYDYKLWHHILSSPLSLSSSLLSSQADANDEDISNNNPIYNSWLSLAYHTTSCNCHWKLGVSWLGFESGNYPLSVQIDCLIWAHFIGNTTHAAAFPWRMILLLLLLLLLLLGGEQKRIHIAIECFTVRWKWIYLLQEQDSSRGWRMVGWGYFHPVKE